MNKIRDFHFIPFSAPKVKCKRPSTTEPEPEPKMADNPAFSDQEPLQPPMDINENTENTDEKKEQNGGDTIPNEGEEEKTSEEKDGEEKAGVEGVEGVEGEKDPKSLDDVEGGPVYVMPVAQATTTTYYVPPRKKRVLIVWAVITIIFGSVIFALELVNKKSGSTDYSNQSKAIVYTGYVLSLISAIGAFHSAFTGSKSATVTSVVTSILLSVGMIIGIAINAVIVGTNTSLSEINKTIHLALAICCFVNFLAALQLAIFTCLITCG